MDAERALAKMAKPTPSANTDGRPDEERAFVDRVPVLSLAGKTTGPAFAGRLKAAQGTGQLRFENARRLREFEHEDYLYRKLEARDAQENWESLLRLRRERGDWLSLRGGVGAEALRRLNLANA